MAGSFPASSRMPGLLRIVPGIAQAGDNEHPLCRFGFPNPSDRSTARAAQSLPGLTVLDGQSEELWLVRGTVQARSTQCDGFTVDHGAEHAWLQQSVPAPTDGDWAALTKQLFMRLHAAIDALGMPHVLRLWAVIPDIHHGEGDEERYKQFCFGRHEAYTTLGLSTETYPAATVIGSRSGQLELQVIAARTPGIPQENPRQTSAYHYPRQNGPRSPSFSRAMLLPGLTLVSGTAAVRGSETQHPGDAVGQLMAIFDNLDTLAASSGRQDWQPAYGRIYLRDADQTKAIREAALQRFPASLAWPILQADICRQDLICEVETAFQPA